MLNPKEAENFYINNSTEFYEKNLGFSPEKLVENSSDELDGIEVLYQMVNQGKIDPWNIDLSDIADKYMLHLAESKYNKLRLGSRAIFFLSALLKVKSNVLDGINPLEFESQQEVDPEYDDSDDSRFNDDLYYQDYYPDNVIPIDDIIQRRTSVKQNRNRIVTLKDLIRQLEFYEKIDKEQSIKSSIERQKRRVQSYANMSFNDILNIAGEEYLERSVKVLQANLVKIFEKEEKVELKTLTLLGLDKMSAYMALLFLTAEGDCDIEQKEFYSDLYAIKAQKSDISEEATV